MMQGRRYSEGLHQALEAKETSTIQPENQTLASITFQNYFRLYAKLAGMTGTALTEANEFRDIYKLDVVEIPTNRAGRPHRRGRRGLPHRRRRRRRRSSRRSRTATRRGQPILVGTVSIEKSEALSDAAREEAKIPHQVLNARYHEQEALIVAQAGVPGAVTIATNMAGRGTDIQLGGNLDMRIRAGARPDVDEPGRARAARRRDPRRDRRGASENVLAAGGLYVVGTERHESRRIDNQLRGRSGRQGDPGALEVLPVASKTT